MFNVHSSGAPANHGVVAGEPGGGGGDRAGALVLGDGARGAGAGPASPPPVASTPGNAVLSHAVSANFGDVVHFYPQISL